MDLKELVWISESKCSTSTFLCLSLCKYCVHVIPGIEFCILAEEFNLRVVNCLQYVEHK